MNSSPKYINQGLNNGPSRWNTHRFQFLGQQNFEFLIKRGILRRGNRTQGSTQGQRKTSSMNIRVVVVVCLLKSVQNPIFSTFGAQKLESFDFGGGGPERLPTGGWESDSSPGWTLIVSQEWLLSGIQMEGGISVVRTPHDGLPSGLKSGQLPVQGSNKRRPFSLDFSVNVDGTFYYGKGPLNAPRSN